MLPSKNRLSSDFDFRRVKNQGRAVHSDSFIFSYLKDSKNPESEPKFGVIVTNKIDKRAVIRHRIRRLINESLQGNLASFGKGYLVVIIAKSSIVDKGYEDISAEFNKVLSKVSFP